MPRRQHAPNGAFHPGSPEAQDSNGTTDPNNLMDNMEAPYHYPTSVDSYNPDSHDMAPPPLPAHLSAFTNHPTNYLGAREDNSFHSLPNLSHMAHMSAPSLRYPVPNSQTWNNGYQDQQSMYSNTFSSVAQSDDAHRPHFTVSEED